jgi:hypothetical protein
MAKYDPEEEKRMVLASDFYTRNPYVKKICGCVSIQGNIDFRKRVWLDENHKTPKGATTNT